MIYSLRYQHRTFCLLLQDKCPGLYSPVNNGCPQTLLNNAGNYICMYYVGIIIACK